MRDFTQGPVFKPLIAFAVPIVVANLLQTFYNLVDTFWIGRLGGDALAAVGLASVIFHFLLSMSWGFSASATTLVAQHYGAGQRHILGRICANLFMLFLAFAALVGSATFTLRLPLLHMMGTPAAIIPDAELYLAINLLGLPIAYSVTLLGAIFRGVGDSVSPMKVVALGNVINVVLDPILIFGFGPIPAYGVAGAAWATVASRFIALLFGLRLLQRPGNPTRIRRTDWRLDVGRIAQAIRIGAPAGAANLLNSLGATLLLRLVTPYGTDAVAAHSVGVRLESLAVMPAVALGQAASNWVGQNLGAGKRDRAFYGAHAVVGTAFGVLAVLGSLAYLAAPRLVAVFAPGEHEVIAFGTVYLHILGFSWALFGTQIVISNTLRGAGDTVANLTLSAVNLFLFRFPSAYVLSRLFDMGAAGVWRGILIGDFLIALVSYGYFRSKRWMRRTVVEGSLHGDHSR